MSEQVIKKKHVPYQVVASPTCTRRCRAEVERPRRMTCGSMTVIYGALVSRSTTVQENMDLRILRIAMNNHNFISFTLPDQRVSRPDLVTRHPRRARDPWLATAKP